jgi:hypothetical protein
LAQPIAFSTFILKEEITLFDSFSFLVNSGLGLFFDFFGFFCGIKIHNEFSQKSFSAHKYHKSSIKLVLENTDFMFKNSFFNIV